MHNCFALFIKGGLADEDYEVEIVSSTQLAAMAEELQHMVSEFKITFS
jgi:hypothetical protein